MLRKCFYDGKDLTLSIDRNSLNKINQFTVIVGKNGTGKSRLLGGIVREFVKVRNFRGIYREFPPMADTKLDLVVDSIPSAIIAVSTSPFDRFPMDRALEVENYRYLGLRGVNSLNLSLAFMSRTMWALLSAILTDDSRAETVQTVLGYLGYEGEIEARFHSVFTRERIEEILGAKDFSTALKNGEVNNYRAHRLGLASRNFSQEELAELREALEDWSRSAIKPRLYLNLNVNGVFDLDAEKPFNKKILQLVRTGFFELRDVGLRKKGSANIIRIADASSGEQCVVLALLGVAAYIRDGALICIDEPEVCLHPEWQEKYIDLLMTAFGHLQGCHFIIATHSPQIVSKLRNDNCFVLNLETGLTNTASDFNGRSIDFQLARVFRAPGFKNEYLSRVIFDALRSLGGGRDISSEKMDEVIGLLSLRNTLSQNDPVRNLMDILQESLEAAGKV